MSVDRSCALWARVHRGLYARRILAALLLTFVAASLHGSELPDHLLPTTLLVFPKKSISNHKVVTPSDLRATVGKVDFHVESVTQSSDVRAIVVLDLSSIPPDYQPCFLEQARALAPQLRQISNLESLVASHEGTADHTRFVDGSGYPFEYFLTPPQSPGDSACPLRYKPWRHDGWIWGWGETERTDPHFTGWDDIYAGCRNLPVATRFCGGATS